ncbi:MAG: TlpA family protein disulfide reductase [Deltaproteobacteria bacterium]|nr:TlpA family protein disulfide reductase [Deltaproteobacteria bacterium]
MTRTFAALALAFGLAFGPTVARADGQVAPNFTLRDINNAEVKLSDMKGKVVVMSFWATWCQPCKAEMPHLQAMYDELGAKGFTVLSVSIDDARAASGVKPYIKSNGFTFPVLLDKETTVVAQYNPDKTVPYTVVIDREGKIRNVHRGYNPGDEKKLREEVLAALGAGQ